MAGQTEPPGSSPLKSAGVDDTKELAVQHFNVRTHIKGKNMTDCIALQTPLCSRSELVLWHSPWHPDQKGCVNSILCMQCSGEKGKAVPYACSHPNPGVAETGSFPRCFKASNLYPKSCQPTWTGEIGCQQNSPAKHGAYLLAHTPHMPAISLMLSVKNQIGFPSHGSALEEGSSSTQLCASAAEWFNRPLARKVCNSNGCGRI